MERKNLLKGYELLGIAVGAILILSVLISGCIGGEKKEEKTLLVYSGAGMKDPMNEIAKEFEKEYGIKVTYVYGGSGVLFAKIETQKTGDVFMPGSELYINIAKEKGYVDESKPVALHIPVIMVAKDNPKNINSLEDLTKENVRVSLGKEDTCAICKLAPKILKKAGVYEGVKKNAVTTSRTTVDEMALDVALGEADAAIVWRSTADGYVKQNKAKIVEIDEKFNIIETIPIAVLKFSKNQDGAEKFKEYVISRKDIWREHGYKVVE